MFELHPAFPPTSEALGDLALSHVRLQADARYAWVVLIPRIAGARELEDLSANDRAALMEEIVRAGAAVRAVGAPRPEPQTPMPPPAAVSAPRVRGPARSGCRPRKAR